MGAYALPGPCLRGFARQHDPRGAAGQIEALGPALDLRVHISVKSLAYPLGSVLSCICASRDARLLHSKTSVGSDNKKASAGTEAKRGNTPIGDRGTDT